MKKFLLILIALAVSSPAWGQVRQVRPRAGSIQSGAINGTPYYTQQDQWGNTTSQSQGNPVIVVPQNRGNFQGSANGQLYWGQTDKWGNTSVYGPAPE